eukprot:jgi/Botrbrau1/3458/Bobra.139_1s0035.2
MAQTLARAQEKTLASDMGRRQLAQAPEEVVLSPPPLSSPPPPDAELVLSPPPAAVGKRAGEGTAAPPPTTPGSCTGFLSMICTFVEPIVGMLSAIPIFGQFVATGWGFIKSIINGFGGGGSNPLGGLFGGSTSGGGFNLGNLFPVGR